MRVLGIDPSSQATGFGIIEYGEGKYNVLAYGAIKISRRFSFHQKLSKIRNELEELISAYSPQDVAIENPFYARNIKTALILGQVRGAVLVAIASHNCSLYEYSALEIKKAITGYGQADKNQVNAMVKNLLQIDDARMSTDASDALAAALCHIQTRIFEERLQASQNGEKQ